jgi:hypothetical protein
MPQGYMNVDAAIEIAQTKLKAKAAILKEIDTIRSDLRNAVARKETTPEQTKWIGEQFPIRERKRKKKDEQRAPAAA